MNIRFADLSDCDAITRIYNYYIRETTITFEEQEIDATEVAHFKEAGFKFDRWIDVGYWQRSP